MFIAYTNYWKQFINFSGRSTRPDYWWVFLLNHLIALLFRFLLIALIFLKLTSIDANESYHNLWESYEMHYFVDYDFDDSLHLGLLALFDFIYHHTLSLQILFALGIFWKLLNAFPRYTLLVRRLRDAGFHWSLIFLRLLPHFLSVIAYLLIFFPLLLIHSLATADVGFVILGLALLLQLPTTISLLILCAQKSKVV